MLPINFVQEQRPERRTVVRMLAIALVLRVALGSFIDASGFDTDLMQSWTRTLLSVPLDQFYAVAEGPDHLPGDLWFLCAIGHGLELFGLDNAPRGPFVALMKLVPAVADVVIAWELFVLVGWFASSRAALIVAAAFAFNPGGIFLTSIWGQWDAVSMALLLGGVLIILKATSPPIGQPRHPERSVSAIAHSHHRHSERSDGPHPLGPSGIACEESPGEADVWDADATRTSQHGRRRSRRALRAGIPRQAQDDGRERGREEGRSNRGGVLGSVPLWPAAVPLLTWAVLIKPPLALVAGVFLLYACVRTALDAPSVRDAVGRTAIATATSLVLGIATALLIILPFDVGLPGMATRWDVLERARYALDLYPFTTLQAANIWMIKDAHLYRPSDMDGALLGLTERTWGSVLLALALAWIAAVVVATTRWRVVRVPEGTLVEQLLVQLLVWAALATSYAIFMLPTRVHERYFLPVMVLALALVGLPGVPGVRGDSVADGTGSWSARIRRGPGHHRGAPYDGTSLDGDRWMWRLALAISAVFLVSLLFSYDHTVNAIRVMLFDVPLSFLFRTLAIVNLGVFLVLMTLPLRWGRRTGPPETG